MIDKSSGYGEGVDSEAGRKSFPTSYTEVGERLSTAMRRIGMDKSVLQTQRSAKQLGRYRNGDEPPLGVVVRLAETSGLSVGWLITGRAEHRLDAEAQVEMLEHAISTAENEPADAALHTENAKLLQLRLSIAKRELESYEGATRGSHVDFLRRRLESVPSDFTMIRRLDVEASAGAGAVTEAEDSLEMLAFRTEWLRRRGINAAAAHVLTARGDSMEPTIRDGDILLVDTSIDRVVDNAIYVVVYWGRTLVKRVQLRLDGSVVLKSDNKDIFDDEAVPGSEVPALNIAGRVMWFGRSI